MLYSTTSIDTDGTFAITQHGRSSLKQPGRHLILSSSLCCKALPTAVIYSKVRRDLLHSSRSPRLEKRWQPGMKRRSKNFVKMRLKSVDGTFFRSKINLRPQITNRIKRWPPRLGMRPIPATGCYSLRLFSTGPTRQPLDIVFSTSTGYRVQVRNMLLFGI